MSDAELKQAEITGYVTLCPHCRNENEVHFSDAGQEMTCQYGHCLKDFRVADQPRPADEPSRIECHHCGATMLNALWGQYCCLCGKTLTKQPRPAVPDGYALMPIEPTDDMLKVRVSPILRIGNPGAANGDRVKEWRRVLYLAMVSAAQQPEGGAS